MPSLSHPTSPIPGHHGWNGATHSAVAGRFILPSSLSGAYAMGRRRRQSPATLNLYFFLSHKCHGLSLHQGASIHIRSSGFDGIRLCDSPSLAGVLRHDTNVRHEQAWHPRLAEDVLASLLSRNVKRWATHMQPWLFSWLASTSRGKGCSRSALLSVIQTPPMNT